MIPKRLFLFDLDDDDNTHYEVPDIIKASYKGEHKVVVDLLNSGHDVNTVDKRDNLSILHIGCMNGDKILVDIVLEREREYGDVNFEIRSLYRPRLAWQYAMNTGHYELGHLVHRAGLAKARGHSGPKP